MNKHQNPNIIGLITDFGIRGYHYVAAMKTNILKILPSAKIIDINHSIEPFSINEVNFMIYYALLDFPIDSAIIVVVDPGVGTNRDIIAVRTTNDVLIIGPDNGMFSLIASLNMIEKIFVVDLDKLQNPEEGKSSRISETFHGRDIMAPAAAILLGKSTEIEKLCEKPLNEILILNDLTSQELTTNEIEATILYVDQFGNLITNISSEQFSVSGKEIKTIKLTVADFANTIKIYQTFNEIPRDKPGLICGSSGFLEICVNRFNASETLKIKSGDKIKFSFD